VDGTTLFLSSSIALFRHFRGPNHLLPSVCREQGIGNESYYSAEIDEFGSAPSKIDEEGCLVTGGTDKSQHRSQISPNPGIRITCFKVHPSHSNNSFPTKPTSSRKLRLGLRCNWSKRLAPSHTKIDHQIPELFPSSSALGEFSFKHHANHRHQEPCLTGVSRPQTFIIRLQCEETLRHPATRPGRPPETEHCGVLQTRRKLSTTETNRSQSTRPLAMAPWHTCRGSAPPATGERSSRKWFYCNRRPGTFQKNGG
jgi:hypothetical protein